MSRKKVYIFTEYYLLQIIWQSLIKSQEGRYRWPSWVQFCKKYIEVRKMLAEEDKGHKIPEIGWWYVRIIQHITLWDLKALSRLQFRRILEKVKYHCKYFGYNQIDKKSVMTYFNLCSNSQESQTQNSELQVFSTLYSYSRWSQGSKNHSIPNKFVTNTEYCSISFCFVSTLSKIRKETVLGRNCLRSCDGTSSAEFCLV